MRTLLEITQSLSKYSQIYNSTISFKVVDNTELRAISSVLPLSEELQTWYETSAPKLFMIKGIANTLVLYDPMQLIPSQAGYRWVQGGEKDEEWDPSWIVIGDIGADPIIAHTNEIGTPISMALHGIGYWHPQRVAPNLSSFLESLTVWLNIIMSHGGISNLLYDFGMSNDTKIEIAENLNGLLDDKMILNLIYFL